MASPNTLDQALAFIERYADKTTNIISLPTEKALGYVLTQDIRAPTALPRFDSAAMDGFAVRRGDLRSDGSATLRLVETLAAGHVAQKQIGPGETVRIMTGAPMPQGADRVVKQEYGKITEDLVELRSIPLGKPHIREIGEDVQNGATVIKAGTRLDVGHLALLIGLGIRSVGLFAKPQVAILSTGDELGGGGEQLPPGRIDGTNRPMLRLMLERAGADVTDLGIVIDDPKEIVSALVSAAAGHDLLISSGGASAGFADHLTAAVSQRGYLEFWKLDIRPGKPVGFGDIDDCPILLLPGNPVAAAGFVLLGRALIEKIGGESKVDRRLVLPIGIDFTKSAGTVQVLLARIESHGPTGSTRVMPLGQQGSASLAALAAAQFLIVLRPEQTTIVAGDLVNVLPLWS